MATINTTIINGLLLPLIFILGDTYVQIGGASRYRYLFITGIKMLSVLLFAIYLVYLCYIREQINRESNNMADLILCIIMTLLLMSTMSMILYKINDDKQNANLQFLI